jgi:hypothetical protein
MGIVIHIPHSDYKMVLGILMQLASQSQEGEEEVEGEEEADDV